MLNASVLRTMIVANVTEAAVAGPLTSFDDVAGAIAAAVVDHIQSSAELDTSLPTLISPGGLTPAPVTGTAKIK